MRDLKSPILLALIILVSTVSNAFAYIDPGSGSVVTTAILGLFAAIGYTFRKYFYKAKDMIFGRGKSAPDETDGRP